MHVDVRRATDRAVSTYDGVVSRHSFSFGPHYDSRSAAFASLVAHNADSLQPRSGYPPHPHHDLEIVTWVLEGELRHEDSTGLRGTSSAGEVQRMSAGSGVQHTEYAGDAATSFVQMWVLPDEPGTAPSYQQAVVPDGSGWATLAAGAGEGLVSVGRRGAALHLGRLSADSRRRELPDAPYLHVYVASGAVRLEGAQPRLGPGDAVRLTGAGGGCRIESEDDAEVLVWAMTPP